MPDYEQHPDKHARESLVNHVARALLKAKPEAKQQPESRKQKI